MTSTTDRPAGRPSITELRAVVQPPSLFARSEESWAGRVYLRRLSLHVTRFLIPTRVSADAVTVAMIGIGLLTAAALSVPGIVTAVVAVLLIQVQILLDCVDGELARWRQKFSARGVYLDHLGHFVTETALPIGIGIRADGGWDSLGTYTMLGLAAALLALFVRAVGALVHAVRAETGRAPLRETEAGPAGGLGRARRAAAVLPFYKLFVAMQLTLVALVAAVVDSVADDQLGSRVLTGALLAAAALTLAGRLAAILLSDRLK